MEAYEEKLTETLANDDDEVYEEIQEDIVDGDMLEKPKPAQRTIKTVTSKLRPIFI